MPTSTSDYGLWMFVIINSLIVILFAGSFFKPKTKLDWRSMGAFSAFIVAMFTEMYGFPVTIYFLSGWLQTRFPELDIFAHENGHLWYAIFGFEGNPHFNPIHLISNVLIFFGFLIVYRAWKTLHAAQQNQELAVTGLYSHIRHPQYGGFLLVMFGFVVMWPTLLTLIMFPIMIIVYFKLAKKEEAFVREEFESAYALYAKKVPAFLPSLRRRKKYQQV